MKLSKKRVGLYGSVITAVLVVSLIVVFMQNSGLVPTSKIAFAAGTPDAQGNHIFSISFKQNSTGVWSTVATLTSASYTLGYTLTIPSNQHTIIENIVKLNSSLASNPMVALTRTRVYITITGVVTAASMTGIAAMLDGSYYACQFYYPSTGTTTWIPATDVTYNVTFQYQAYY
jgi:hypothetical protein